MATNTVDVLIRLRNQVIGVFALQNLTAGLRLLVANIDEAQKAQGQLDAAFKATGANLGLTRKRLDELATSIQETTTFGDDLVKQGEAILLTFTRVRGQAFERTVKAATDLSVRLGTDLTSSIRLLGKALQDPERGLTQLRKAGVSFTGEQEKLIKNFTETGQVAAAQNIILGEVEKRFAGSAAAARNTLGGALAGLKNAFGDVFESTEKGTDGAVKAINSLSKALSDPKIKEGIDVLIAGLASIVTGLANVSIGLINATDNLSKFISKKIIALNFDSDTKRLKELITLQQEFSRLAKQGRQDTFFEALGSDTDGSLKRFQDLNADLIKQGIDPSEFKAFIENRLRQVTAEIERERAVVIAATTETQEAVIAASDAATDAQIDNLELLEEVIIRQKKKELLPIEEFYAAQNELSKTATERQIADFNEVKAALLELKNIGAIDSETFNARLGEAQDKLLPEFDIAAIRSQFKTIEQQSSETSTIVKGAFQQAGASIQANLSEAVQSGKLSFRSLVDVARKAVADIVSALIVSKITSLLGGALFGPTGAAVGAASGSFVGPRATGGFASSPFIAGEEGPELIDPRGNGRVKVINKRMAQFAGASAGSNVFAPQTNIQIIERENPERLKQEIFQVVAIQNARNEEKFIARLGNNGVNIR